MDCDQRSRKRLRLRLLSAPLAVVLAGGFWPATTSSANGGTQVCSPGSATRQAANSRAAIYMRTNKSLFGCLVGRRARIELLDGFYQAFPRPAVALRGTLVAFGANVEQGAGDERLLLVRDLRKPTPPFLLDLPAGGHIGNLKLRGARRVVWMVCEGGTGPLVSKPRCREDPAASIIVYKHDARSTSRGIDELDSGRSIRVDSLRLSGDRVSWKHGNRTRSYRLR